MRKNYQTRGTLSAWRPSARLGASILAIVLAASLTACSSTHQTAGATLAANKSSPKHIRVGIFLIESASLITQIQSGFEQGFLASSHLTRSQVTFDVKNADGNETLIEGIAQSYAQGNDAMVAVIGTPAVIALAKLTTTKPIIAVAMGDPVGSKVAKSLQHPGMNVSGSTDYIPPSALLPELLKVQPRFSSLGTIYNPSDENSQVWASALKAAAKANGVSLDEATITSSAQDATAAQSLQGRVKAVLIGPDADAIAGIPSIAKAATTGRQALYLVGGDVTTPGVLASLGANYATLGSDAGLIGAKVVAGTPIGSIPFFTPKGLVWAVNKQTQATLHVTLPPEALAG